MNLNIQPYTHTHTDTHSALHTSLYRCTTFGCLVKRPNVCVWNAGTHAWKTSSFIPFRCCTAQTSYTWFRSRYSISSCFSHLTFSQRLFDNYDWWGGSGCPVGQNVSAWSYQWWGERKIQDGGHPALLISLVGPAENMACTLPCLCSHSALSGPGHLSRSPSAQRCTNSF